LLMSATILDHRVFCENLGIDLDDVEFIRAPSTFPFENRPIRLRYAGSMSYRNRRDTLPRLVEKIEKGLDLHTKDRGIIHTHAFSIAHFIRDNVSPRLRERLLFQEDFHNKDAMLEAHARREASVIVAPAMHEGLDLKDDLSRFQMICKVPYPNANADKQLKMRTQANWHYYLWLTARPELRALDPLRDGLRPDVHPGQRLRQVREDGPQDAAALVPGGDPVAVTSHETITRKDDRPMSDHDAASEPITVSEVRVRMAEDDNPVDGLLAWASCVINGSVLLNNIAIFRDPDGNLKTKFPYKRGRAGQKYYHCCPISREAKAIIDRAILRGFSA